MTLKLVYKELTTVPVEIEDFTPDWAFDKSIADIERFEVFHGNRQCTLADLFSITGDASDKHFVFEGNLAGVHWIGAHMRSGNIIVHGPAGRHLGSQMAGGEITVLGDAGGWAGAEMRKGIIRIKGNAGHLVGAAYRGSAKGMLGGTILVEGNAGNEIGLTMRRGLIAIGGAAGDLVGFNMIAGTVVVMGQCGIRPGAGMRRGTLALLGPIRVPLLPSFRYAARYRPQVLSVLLRILIDQGFPVDQSLLKCEFELFHGDLVSLGRGEVFFKSAA